MKGAKIAVSSFNEPLQVNLSEAANGINLGQIFYLEGSPDYYLGLNAEGYMDVLPVPAGYSGIALPPVEGGSVTSNMQFAQSGKYVTLTVKEEKGYKFDSFVFYDAEGNVVPVKVTWLGTDQYVFKAPKESVIVEAQFKNKSRKADIRSAVQIAVGAITVATVAVAATKLIKPVFSNIGNKLADIFKPVNFLGTDGLLSRALKAIKFFGEDGLLSKLFSLTRVEMLE